MTTRILHRAAKVCLGAPGETSQMGGTSVLPLPAERGRGSTHRGPGPGLMHFHRVRLLRLQYWYAVKNNWDFL